MSAIGSGKDQISKPRRCHKETPGLFGPRPIVSAMSKHDKTINSKRNLDKNSLDKFIIIMATIYQAITIVRLYTKHFININSFN